MGTAAWGPYAGKETGETALLRQLFEQLQAGDVVVADRYYCSYWMVALLRERGVAVVFRLHQKRHCDFRRGQRLGRSDHLVEWSKPARPAWLDVDTYERLPASLRLREARFRTHQAGCRRKEIIVATTLCEVDDVSKDRLADLYHQRWHVELDIRAIKQTLHMDFLVCKSPAMVPRELWVPLLGYNLIRKVLAEAAQRHGHLPRQLSLAGGLQTLEAFRWLRVCGRGDGRRGDDVPIVLLALSSHRVGTRPGRWEPRRVKRRPKKYKKLREPRAQARHKLRHRPNRDQIL